MPYLFLSNDEKGIGKKLERWFFAGPLSDVVAIYCKVFLSRKIPLFPEGFAY